MKTYFFIFSLVILLFSCSSPENKVKKAIKEELRLTLHDFKSYEPVQFGKIETASSSWEYSPEVAICYGKEEKFLSLCKEYGDKADFYDYDHSSETYLKYYKLYNDYMDSIRLSNDKIDSIKLHFVPEVIGWQMIHSFRAKNLAGNLGMHQYQFVFDKDITHVIRSVDLSEE
jgi:hypothetical protein